jgi:hypothetical protein
MPNWCENKLIIRADRQMIEQISADAEHKGFDNDGPTTLDFRKIIPEPKYPDDQAWYEWRCENWGTKWNATGITRTIDISGDKGTLTYTFDTAWSPPLRIYQAIIHKYKTICMEVYYFEGGCDFAGLIVQNESGEVEQEHINSCRNAYLDSDPDFQRISEQIGIDCSLYFSDMEDPEEGSN